jgi:hypothetical protein
MTEQEQQMMQQQMMQQQGQQAAPSPEEQMMMQQQQQAPQQAPQQGGQDEAMQQIMQFVQQAVSQGMEPLEVAQLLMSKQVPPEVIMQVFVQVGLSEADAQTVIQQAMASGQAEAGAEQPMQEGEPMPPEGQPGEQPMPPQEQPPMGRGGMMYAEEGMAVNNEELDTIMSQVQEMLAQPNADIRVIMQEIQKAAQSGQISPETATTVLETLQQNMPSQTEPTQGMPSEEEMYAQQQMMNQQGQAGLARFGGNLNKLLKKAAGGSTNFPDDTSENYGQERTNSFLDAVKGNFFNAQLDDAAQQFPSLNGYAYGGELMSDANMYADGGTPCPPCPDGTIPVRLPDGSCPCELIPTEDEEVEQGVSSIDEMLLNNNNPNTVLTAPQPNNPNQEALNDIIDHNFKFSLEHGKRNRFTADINNKGQANFNYNLLPSKSGFYGGIGAGSDLNKNTNYTNLNAGYIIPNVLGSTLDINGNVKMIDQNARAAFNANLKNKNGFGASAGYATNGEKDNWNAGVSYNRDGTKTTPNIRVGLNYTGSANPQTLPTHENGGLVKAVDGISMKAGKLVVDPSQYKDADAYELAYRRWNADPKNAKFLVDPKTNPYKTITPYTFKDTDPGIVIFEETPRVNPAKYKSDAEYKAAIFDWNKKNKGTANVIDVDKIPDYIPLPPEKEVEKKVEFQDGKKYTYDAKTKSWAEDLGTPAFNLSVKDWADLSQASRDAMNVQQKAFDAFKKNVETYTKQGSQPVNYNQPNAAFLNPWARFFMGGMEGNQGVKTNAYNLPPGFDVNTSLKNGMRGVTVGEDGRKYAWKVTSQENYKKRVPGLFNNERGNRLNIEWGDADDKGNIIVKDNGGNKITPEKTEIAQDPKDKTNNIPVVVNPNNNKKSNGTGIYQEQNEEIFDENGNVIIPGVNTTSAQTTLIKDKNGNLVVDKSKPDIPAANSVDPRFEDERKITYIDGDSKKIINEPMSNEEMLRKQGKIWDEKTNKWVKNEMPRLEPLPVGKIDRQPREIISESSNNNKYNWPGYIDYNQDWMGNVQKLKNNISEAGNAWSDYINFPEDPANYGYMLDHKTGEIIKNPKGISQDERGLVWSGQYNNPDTSIDESMIWSNPVSQKEYNADPEKYHWDDSYIVKNPDGTESSVRGYSELTSSDFSPYKENDDLLFEEYNNAENNYNQSVAEMPQNIRKKNYIELNKQVGFDLIQPDGGVPNKYIIGRKIEEIKKRNSPFRYAPEQVVNGKTYARGGNVYEIGGKPPCAAGEAEDPNTGLCMDASTLGVRNNEANFRGMFKNLFNREDPVVGPNRTANKPTNPFKNLTATGSDDPNVMPKMPTISAMNAFNNSFGQRVDPKQQGSLSISDEKTWQQKADQRENLADGLYGTAGSLTNFFNKVRAIDPERTKAFNSTLNQPMMAQSDQSKGLYADNGDLLSEQIGNQVLNPTNSYGSEQIVASPGLTFSKYGGNIFEYGGNIYELGGDIELTDEEMQELAASGFYFEPA